MSTTPDPRPAAIRGAADHTATIAGRRCTNCGLATVSTGPGCPACGSDQVAASFGPRGTVWSSTVVRVPVPGRVPPYVLAYVDLVDGPRVLCHLDGPTGRVSAGTPVDLVGHNELGDLTAEPVTDRDTHRPERTTA